MRCRLMADGQHAVRLRDLLISSASLPATVCNHKPPTSKRFDLLRLLAEAGDAERDHVARFEELRLGLHAERHARRRAGHDDVARLHDEELRAIPDEVFDPENHGARVAALTLLAIDVEPHIEALRVLDLVLGHEPGSDRPEGL